MFIGGAIDYPMDMRVPKEEINSVNWEYQVTETKWMTYPKSISLLIERQKQNSQNTPIYYQLGNGTKYKINHLNSLQFDLKNNSVVMIRRSNKSETKQFNYNKCPKCLFKVAMSDKICKICDTNIHEELLKQYNNSSNNNIKPKQEQKQLPPKQEQKSQPIPKEEKIEPNESKPALQHNELLCPFCKEKNKTDFNFCVKCGFDLRDYEKPKKCNENENYNDDKDDKNEMKNEIDHEVKNEIIIDENDKDDTNEINNEIIIDNDHIEEPGSNNNKDIDNDIDMNNAVVVADNNIFDNGDDDDDNDIEIINEPEGPGAAEGNDNHNNNNNNNNNSEQLEFAQDWH